MYSAGAFEWTRDEEVGRSYRPRFRAPARGYRLGAMEIGGAR
jgi:hypothetical protein